MDKDSIEGRSVVGSTWMSGLRLRVVIVWAAVCARCVALVQIYNRDDAIGWAWSESQGNFVEVFVLVTEEDLTNHSDISW